MARSMLDLKKDSSFNKIVRDTLISFSGGVTDVLQAKQINSIPVDDLGPDAEPGADGCVRCGAALRNLS